MADEQTGDFFMPPADDTAGFVGDVDAVGASATDEQDFFNPPEQPPTDAPIILGAPSSYEAPVDDDAGLGFAAAPSGVETVSDDEEDLPASGGGMELVNAEPTPMSKWNEEWQETLLTRKDEENSIKAAAVEKAREDIAKFQEAREKRRESRMAKNRSDEQDKLEAIEADLENDNSWQRVVKMIELNQDSSEGAGDTGRMKDVLVLLKNEPSMAEALGA